MNRRRPRRLARRYGCFRLPRVPGARRVAQAKRGDVGWLARTDVDAREVEFSEHWNRLTPAAKKHIALHEQAHLKTSEKHDAAFYKALWALVEKHRVPWKVVAELESYNCHAKH